MITILLLMLAPCLAAHAEPVTLADALRGALERDASFVIQRAEADRGLAEAEQAERAYLGRLSIKSTGARYATSVFEDRYTATAAASLTLAAAGGSTVSVDARDSSFYLNSRADELEMYYHDPSVGVTLRQPLVAGGLPAGELSRAARSKPAALRAGALVSLGDARNDAILRAATLYFRFAEQRKRVAFAEARLAERRKDLENLERGSSLRLGGRREVERERLSIREDEIGLADLKSALARLEPELGRLLGRSAGEPDYGVPAPPAAPQAEELRRKAAASNGRIRRADADLATKRAEAALASVSGSPALNLGVILNGVYEEGTDTVERPADQALSGLRPRLTLSLLLDLPLGQRRDRELERSRADALVLEAATERARAEDEVAADAADLVGERGRLADLVEIRRQQAALAREELRTQTDLLPSGQATAADIALARLDVDERELSAWRARADLYLADLRAAALAGDDLARLLLTGSRQAAAGAP